MAPLQVRSSDGRDTPNSRHSVAPQYPSLWGQLRRFALQKKQRAFSPLDHSESVPDLPIEERYSVPCRTGHNPHGGGK
jgi:hypothetical protein